MMSVALVILAGIGGVLAAATVYLVTSIRIKERAALAALADHRGWDHQTRGPGDMEPHVRRLFPRDDDHMGVALLDYLAGPTMVGPFRFSRVRLTRTDQHPKHTEITFLHIRTPLACPGLHLGPAESFHASSGRDDDGPEWTDRFSRLYQARGEDTEFTTYALDPDTRQFIAAPRRTIRLDWRERDLLIAFPFAVRTPHSVEALVTWGTAVASRLNEAHTTGPRRRAIEPTRQDIREPQSALGPDEAHPTIG